MAETFDYIVVGGGTAGPVAARRLAEYFPTSSVLLVEAGTSHENVLHSTMAMGWEGLHHSDWDWRYTSQPMKHANERQIHLPRGKILGGSSALNGTLMIRGVKEDYDRLAHMGIEGWSWDEVLPFFKQSETFHPSDGMKGDPAVHGTTGELHTSHHPLAPISERVVDSFLGSGLSWKEDMFSQGESEGVGHVPRTVHDGVRTSGADFVTGDGVPRNLTIRLAHQCTRIVSREGGSDGLRVATGVELRSNTTGAPSVVNVSKEVVVSCGSYNSPQLLMLSGIGERAQLARFNIPCVRDLGGVGQHLGDHIIVFNFFQVNTPQLTNDHLLYDEGAFDRAVSQYMGDRTGVLGSFPFGAFVFKRLDDELKDDPEWRAALAQSGGADPMGATNGTPHVEYFWTECYGGGPQHVDQPGHGESAFALITLLFNPRSRGSVTLQGRNPLFPPRIDHNYLAEPLDVVMLAEACRFGADVVTHGRGTRDVVAGPWPASRTLPTDREGWKAYVREQAGTCYHPAGTCAMGPTPEPSETLPRGSVVDARLKVHGFANLRVADVSVLPLVHSGHTQAPAYMIGEKAAFMMAEDAKAAAAGHPAHSAFEHPAQL